MITGINFQNAEFEKSAVAKEQYPKSDMLEFAFAGRSNVGKSSMINKVLNRKSLARVSGTPGKTITINFYNIDKKIYLVDLPGYGYAKRSKEEVAKWGNMMEDYLANREQLVQTILLVDSRHTPTAQDIQMAEWIRHYHDRLVVIATKMDKLKKSEIDDRLNDIADTLELTEEDILIPFSTNSDEGKELVIDLLHLMREGILLPYDEE
ncbi:MAG: YihA family ribosome biogenesis GTP-binding protein [Clostridia bacterium]|nr:YihA family ribosome biogenesis GTP-binding protein [Clostridia bacterium]MEE0410148.1 ribosome biogenesis GTP-binding protein YihA/YsxC [Clostridia bacterium]